MVVGRIRRENITGGVGRRGDSPRLLSPSGPKEKRRPMIQNEEQREKRGKIRPGRGEGGARLFGSPNTVQSKTRAGEILYFLSIGESTTGLTNRCKKILEPITGHDAVSI